MGFWSMVTPVALKMALRMAGAPEQAGGSPRALVPKAEVGSAMVVACGDRATEILHRL